MLWTPSGIVTLLTDFGLRDSYVGTMRAVLASRCPDLRHTVDLTHAIPQQDVAAGAFQLAQAWSYFPAGTVHLAVVDPGVGSERGALVACDRGHAFVGPDNGLLTPCLSDEAEVFELDVELFSLPSISRTFHGRDVFAPAAAALAGGTQPSDLGTATEEYVRYDFPEPARSGSSGRVEGEVLLVDHFGNLISNLPESLLAELAPEQPRQLSICGHRLPIVGAYAEVEQGELLVLVNSSRFLEVAVRGGSAAELLSCGVGERIEMELSR